MSFVPQRKLIILLRCSCIPVLSHFSLSVSFIPFRVSPLLCSANEGIEFIHCKTQNNENNMQVKETDSLFGHHHGRNKKQEAEKSPDEENKKCRKL
jgi:hypothetical protein